MWKVKPVLNRLKNSLGALGASLFICVGTTRNHGNHTLKPEIVLYLEFTMMALPGRLSLMHFTVNLVLSLSSSNPANYIKFSRVVAVYVSVNVCA